MSLRRSARLESKPAVTFNKVGAETAAEEDVEFAEILSDSDHEPAVHKKRKIGPTSLRNAVNSKKNVKGKRGRLRQLPCVKYLMFCRHSSLNRFSEQRREMPLDILYEVGAVGNESLTLGLVAQSA